MTASGDPTDVLGSPLSSGQGKGQQGERAAGLPQVVEKKQSLHLLREEEKQMPPRTTPSRPTQRRPEAPSQETSTTVAIRLRPLNEREKEGKQNRIWRCVPTHNSVTQVRGCLVAVHAADVP